MIRVDVKPELLRWARERAGARFLLVERQFPSLGAWERGEVRPTLKQVEKFAKATATPVGYLFLPSPPLERCPIPDLRTVGNYRIDRPSPELLDTVYTCQQRQEWYRDHARSTGEEPRGFVRSARMTSGVVATAELIRRSLGLDLDVRRRMPTWTDALRAFMRQADEIGILVMASGVVLNNNHRRLDPDEFRGFALSDAYAPLVFVNASDTKAAQMFTLAHEIAHVWLGESGVSDSDAASIPDRGVEQWCNQVAAELLAPLAPLREEYRRAAPLAAEVARLARVFKVSTLVILRRMHDAGGLTQSELREAYDAELARLRAIQRVSGGDFYLTQVSRIGRRFASALVGSTLEGQTTFLDAFRMLGFSKQRTFRELGRSLGLHVV